MIASLLRAPGESDRTYGLFTLGKFTCVSLELPWQDNRKRVSCIPTGMYACEKVWRRRGLEYTFEVTSVPNRSSILIHVGNTVADTQGCILLGYAIVPHGIAGSKNAINDFITATRNIVKFNLLVASV